VYGVTTQAVGSGVFGRNASTNAVGALANGSRAVFGSNTDASGYAGYFDGRTYCGGYVGVGASNPAVPLHIGVGTDASLAGGGYVVIGGIGGANIVMDANEIMARNNGAASNLYLNVGGGNVGIGTGAPNALLTVNGTASKPGGGSWATFSDARLKKNVRPLTGALEKLLRLRGVTFEYINPASINELPGVHTGMVAQEVEKVAPEWVTSGPTGLKSVAFSGYEALTVEALRESTKAQEEARARMQELERENEALRKRLARLEAAVEALGSSPGAKQ
jgi:hypothetical protein